MSDIWFILPYERLDSKAQKFLAFSPLDRRQAPLIQGGSLFLAAGQLSESISTSPMLTTINRFFDISNEIEEASKGGCDEVDHGDESDGVAAGLGGGRSTRASSPSLS